MSSSKPKKQTVGYKYYLSMHLALCHGTIGAIRSVWFSDKVAWTGNLTKTAASQTFKIDKAGLFGGEDSEGGVQGTFEIGFGGFDQELLGVNNDGTYHGGIVQNPPSMATQYRGLAVLNLHGVYIGTSPYLKDISVEVERYWDDWYPEVARIGIDANPAHIIYECCVNDQWGLGYSADLLDDTSMRAAALKLYNEGFGLSMLWSEQTTIDDFINEVLTTIDADFFFDHLLGKWRLRLIRGTDTSVHTFDPSNCVVSNMTRRGIGEVVNQLYVKYVSRDTEEYVSVAIQDLAAIEAQGGASSSTKEYRGIRSESLALSVCQRDLQSISSTLSSVTLTANRVPWNVGVGDVVTLEWPRYQILSMQMRVSSIEYADSESSDMTFSLIEDVFGKVSSVFGEGTNSGWEDVQTPATPFDALVPLEIPYWFIARAGGEDVDELAAWSAVLPVTDNAGMRVAEFYTGDPASDAGMTFAMSSGRVPSGFTVGALQKEVVSTLTIAQDGLTGAGEIPYNAFVMIGTGVNAEITRVRGTGADRVFIIDRGLLDTQPRTWPAGTRVYFISEDNVAQDEAVHVAFTSITYRAIMQTQIDSTDPLEAQTVTVPMIARQGRPYAPANIRFNGDLWPSAVEAGDLQAIEISWSNRNRLLQVTDEPLQWDAESVALEAGATITVEISQGGVVKRLFDGLTGSGLTVPMDGLSRGDTQIRIWSERGALDSYQIYSHTFELVIDEVTVNWPAVAFPGPRLAIVGDSISAVNGLYLPGNGSRYERYSMSQTGYWPKAAQLINHRLMLEPGLQPDLNGQHKGLNVAIAGSRVMDWWLKEFDTLGDGVLNPGPMYVALKNIDAFDVAIVMGGTNDLAFNRTAGQVLANIKKAVSDLASKGKWVFVSTITPRTTDLLQGYTAAQQAVIRSRLAQVNDGLKAWVNSTRPPNVWLFDAFAATVGPNGIDPAGLVSSTTDATAASTPGNYRTDAPNMAFTVDGLHPTTAGAQFIGTALAQVILAAGVPNRAAGTLGPYNLSSNIIPNPSFDVTTTRPTTGYSNVLGRALGLGAPLINSTHAVGPDTFGNVGLGYTFGQVPDYWFFYRSSNSDNESYSNFSQYMWADLAGEWPELVPYLPDSTWTEGAAKTSIVTIDGKKGLKIEFRTPATGNKNEAFVVRTYIPQGQHGPWDNYNNGNLVVPNTAYAAGDQLAVEAEVRLSNIQGLHTAMINMDFLSIDTAAQAGGDYSTAGSVISGVTGGMDFWPPSAIDLVRTPQKDVNLIMRTPAVVAPTPAATENQQYARIDFQFACDASTAAASVTVIIMAPAVNKLSVVPFPPELPDQHGLGHDLGQNLGGSQ